MLNSASLIEQSNAWVAAFPYISIHVSGTPAAPGAESSAGRELAGWTVDGNGNKSIPSDVPFTGGAAGGPAVLIGYWSTAGPGGTYGGGQLADTNPPNDTTFNAAGEATVKAGLSENVTST